MAAIKTTHKGIDSSAYESQNAFQICAGFGEMPKHTTKERDGFAESI